VDVAPLVLRENAHGVEAVDRAGSWSVSDGAKRDRQPGGDTEERAAPVYRDRMETEMVEAADERADRSSRLWLREVVPGAALHRAARAERRDPLLGRVFWMGCPVPSAPLFLTSRETGWAREDDRVGAGVKDRQGSMRPTCAPV
jgi:hypothetical protein